MNNFTKTVDTNLRVEGYNNQIYRTSDYDSFCQQSSLSFANARAAIKSQFDNSPKAVLLMGPLTLSMTAGQSLQYQVMMYRHLVDGNDPIIGQLAEDVTAGCTWVLTDSSTSNVVTVVNGLITGVNIGSVNVYAIYANLKTATISVSVG